MHRILFKPDAVETTITPLQRWRNQALNIILFVSFGVGLITLPTNIWTVWRPGQFHLAFLFGAVLLILGLVAFMRRIRYGLRVGVLLTMAFLLSVTDLFSFGYSRDANLLLFISLFLSTLLIGARWSSIMLGASLIVLARIIWLSSTGQLHFPRDPGAPMVDPVTLIGSWTTFFMLSAIMIAALQSLISWLHHSVVTAEQASRTAMEARAQAEAQASQLAQQSAALSHTEQQLRQLVATLETPTIPLANEVLLAPIVGSIDRQRAQKLTERLLIDAQQEQATTVIIDLAGVAVVDTQVAQALIQATQALRLLGCRVVVTGISASVATTFTRLELELHDIQIARSPRDVLVSMAM